MIVAFFAVVAFCVFLVVLGAIVERFQ